MYRTAIALLALAAVFAVALSCARPPGSDWPFHGHDAGGQRYSSLEAINRANVSSLHVAWTFRTGDAYTPPHGRPFDIGTGQELWKAGLPTSARSMPMTFRAQNGRQFLVIAAGGHGIPGGPPLGDYLIAFSL
jgi:glucose dehydrogenase